MNLDILEEIAVRKAMADAVVDYLQSLKGKTITADFLDEVGAKVFSICETARAEHNGLRRIDIARPLFRFGLDETRTGLQVIPQNDAAVWMTVVMGIPARFT